MVWDYRLVNTKLKFTRAHRNAMTTFLLFLWAKYLFYDFLSRGSACEAVGDYTRAHINVMTTFCFLSKSQIFILWLSLRGSACEAVWDNGQEFTKLDQAVKCGSRGPNFLIIGLWEEGLWEEGLGVSHWISTSPNDPQNLMTLVQNELLKGTIAQDQSWNQLVLAQRLNPPFERVKHINQIEENQYRKLLFE